MKKCLLLSVLLFSKNVLGTTSGSLPISLSQDENVRYQEMGYKLAGVLTELLTHKNGDIPSTVEECIEKITFLEARILLGTIFKQCNEFNGLDIAGRKLSLYVPGNEVEKELRSVIQIRAGSKAVCDLPFSDEVFHAYVVLFLKYDSDSEFLRKLRRYIATPLLQKDKVLPVYRSQCVVNMSNGFHSDDRAIRIANMFEILRYFAQGFKEKIAQKASLRNVLVSAKKRNNDFPSASLVDSPVKRLATIGKEDSVKESNPAVVSDSPVSVQLENIFLGGAVSPSLEAGLLGGEEASFYDINPFEAVTPVDDKIAEIESSLPAFELPALNTVNDKKRAWNDDVSTEPAGLFGVASPSSGERVFESSAALSIKNVDETESCDDIDPLFGAELLLDDWIKGMDRLLPALNGNKRVRTDDI